MVMLILSFQTQHLRYFQRLINVNTNSSNPHAIIKGELSSKTVLSGSLKGTNSLSGVLSNKPSPIYKGSYVFTPTQDNQSIPISGLMATKDITINPIPHNYGLITWDGSVLTVS